MDLLRHWRRDDRGGALVEFTLTLPIFLALLFAAIDFAQIHLRFLLAERAVQVAVRLASVRPPLCVGVPQANERADGPLAALFGATCRRAPQICTNPGTITCTGASAVAGRFAPIAQAIDPFLPATVQAEDVAFSYTFADLGFLGGPYLPQVSVELSPDAALPFITPLGPLLAAFYAGDPGQLEGLELAPIKATLPAEDLALGVAG